MDNNKKEDQNSSARQPGMIDFLGLGDQHQDNQYQMGTQWQEQQFQSTPWTHSTQSLPLSSHLPSSNPPEFWPTGQQQPGPENICRRHCLCYVGVDKLTIDLADVVLRVTRLENGAVLLPHVTQCPWPNAPPHPGQSSYLSHQPAGRLATPVTHCPSPNFTNAPPHPGQSSYLSHQPAGRLTTPRFPVQLMQATVYSQGRSSQSHGNVVGRGQGSGDVGNAEPGLNEPSAYRNST